ncbi:hypothetical protein DRQ09_04770 [candidate division KSB1 bacterium]|nr:MAG: hypothetical protein DRQ09_04770 [candidate division KSB1 bacterium]
MSQHKILIVDDEENILRALRRLFIETDYVVSVETSPKRALKLLEKEKFSLIISDQKMPEMTGIEMLKIAKKIQPDAIRIVLSGYAEVGIIISAINEGEIYKFITKPWDDDNMLLEVKKALEYYELKTEKEALMKRIEEQNKQLKRFNEELEKKVEEKTRELKLAYSEKVLLTEQLKEKVEELKGRDIILQHLLSIHSLDETLKVTLKVINNILKIKKAVIYIKDYKDNFLEAKSGIGTDEEPKKSGKIELNNEDNDIVKVFKSGKIIKNDEDNYLLQPIKKDQKSLGVIEIVSNEKITEGFIEKLSGFTSLAAIAINDSIINENLPEIQSKIEEILGEI